MFYLQKDITKFEHCTKLITRGAVGSSSYKYMDPTKLNLPASTAVNSSVYTSEDIVGISINGRRHNRIPVDKVLVKLAVESGASIIKDSSYNTYRQFNIGERELEAYLLELGATCIDNNAIRSIWCKCP